MGDRTDSDVRAYDPVANTWTERNPRGDLPSVRMQDSVVYDPVAKKMILFGGAGQNGLLNDTWAYDPAANTWTELHPGGESCPRGAWATPWSTIRPARR